MNSLPHEEQQTALQLENVFEQLLSREPIFHRPEYGHTREDFISMTADDFWEIGASGQIYSREFVLDELDKRVKDPPPDVWEVSEFRCRPLCPKVYLATYNLLQHRTRLTRRSTIWRLTPGGWKILFHQGTLVPQE